MSSSYRDVLLRRDVARVLIPYAVARLPLSMTLLALLLLARSDLGSFRLAGVACATYSAAAAIGSPLLGRLVDRRGQRRVLGLCAVIHATCLVGAVVAASRGSFWGLLPAVAVAGAFLPPMSACMRSLWPVLLGEDVVATGFSIEAILVEVAELSGPLLVSAALVIGRPSVAVLVSAAMTGVGTLLFITSPLSRTSRREGGPRRRLLGALAVPGIGVLLVVVFASTAGIGIVEVAVTAYARAHGGVASTGVYIAVISVGGVIAGLIAGKYDLAGRPGRLAGVLAATAAAALGLSAACGRPFVVPALLVFGAAVTVGVVLQMAIMAGVAPAAVRTEAFSWGATANFCGLGAGNLLAGVLLAHHSVAATLALAAAPNLLAAVAVLAAIRLLGPSAPEAAVPAVDEPSRRELDPREARLAALEDAVAELRRLLVGRDEGAQLATVMTEVVAQCRRICDDATAEAERVRREANAAAVEVLAAARRDAEVMIERALTDAEAMRRRMRAVVPAQPASTEASAPAA